MPALAEGAEAEAKREDGRTEEKAAVEAALGDEEEGVGDEAGGDAEAVAVVEAECGEREDSAVVPGYGDGLCCRTGCGRLLLPPVTG